ncbi:hypothetical protein Adt_47450 [Abeliophyllum distichum]|uniref:Uncharacterized protein n=1 Tax=Abeliophyllum distichum TaxID=126358 RepID=A0ABD1NWW2_9LAMI
MAGMSGPALEPLRGKKLCSGPVPFARINRAGRDEEAGHGGSRGGGEGRRAFKVVVIGIKGGGGALNVLLGAATGWDVSDSAAFSPIPPSTSCRSGATKRGLGIHTLGTSIVLVLEIVAVYVVVLVL